MAFCMQCGNQLNEGSAFCGKCGAKVYTGATQSHPTNNGFFNQLNSTVKKAMNGAQKVVSDISGSQSANTSSNNTSHTMYEVFTPALGLGKKFIFTENSLIYGSAEYAYSELTQINITNPPRPMSNGVAQTNANGKYLTLAFEYSQKERFASAVTYANEQIASANGVKQNYKYILQSPNGTKLEIYEDYAILYYLKSGYSSILSNSMKGGSSGSIVYFSDLTLQMINTVENTSALKIDILGNNGASPVSMPLNPQDIETAKAVISYIEEVKNSKQDESKETTPDKWEQVVGSIRKFPLCGKELEISESMDIFNSYRLKFRELASICADNARIEYDRKVQNLTTFLGFYPNIYQSYLSVLIKQSMNILISEGIWTVTEDSFEQQHLADFHLGMNDYTTTLESIELTLQANRRRMSSLTSLIPNLSGGGFGLKGAVKGIATATAFNIVRDGAEAGLINSVSNISQAQQAELYGRIKPDYLFECVFTDYWRVFLSLVYLLNKNGKSIWWLTNETTQQANNIFQNMSNPNFPQDKLLDVFLDILKTNPYNTEYHKFMLSRFGENEETTAIKNYFGYTDFDNPRII
ncbi:MULTISPECIES: zinc ribbon domain-containing protein [Ruminococcus]|jgi:hypothetical protein|uniref:zinc ribbon domain-containing protein n=1 Tax=Ruminococcus TaxID=1263 RepID=UPI0023F7A42C|nr:MULTISPECIES: zinc ribbon domain-containing protein [Ruminococcus]MEE1396662.1 hypothetical protein [Ruminococcus sp.]